MNALWRKCRAFGIHSRQFQLGALAVVLCMPVNGMAAQNLVPNPSFENSSLAPWQSWQNMYLAGWGARSGQFAALAGSNGGGDTSVAISPGRTYTLTAWGRLEQAGNAVIGYQLVDASWQNVGGEVRADSFQTSYAARSLTFTAPGNATRVKLTVWNSSAGNLYLDDVSLVEQGGLAVSNAPPVVSTNAGSSSTGAVNSVATIISDMSEMNDLPLVGVNPAYGFSQGPGFNIMGNNASGGGLPSWYAAAYPQMANTGYWKGILPWFVMFHGQGNGASNTRVQMRGLKLYVLSRSTNQWRQLTSVNDVGGEFCPQGSNYHSCTGGLAKQYEPDGGVSIKPRWGQDLHGWYGSRQAIQGWDIKAVFVTMQAKLVVDNPWLADDRWRARYLLDVGADYYPEMANSSVFLPGVGVSRAKLVKPDWQSFNFITLSDVGKQEPGGGISSGELWGNPPPMD